MQFTHFENGQAIMVNIGEKSPSHRVTKAVLFGTRFSVPLARKAMTLTHEFIPMAHPLPIAPLNSSFKRKAQVIEVQVSCDYKTGLELEAIMAAAGFMKEIPYLGFAAITHKEGGKSGTLERRAQIYREGFSFQKGIWYRVVGKGWLKATEHGLEKVPDFQLETGDVILCSLQ